MLIALLIIHLKSRFILEKGTRRQCHFLTVTHSVTDKETMSCQCRVHLEPDPRFFQSDTVDSASFHSKSYVDDSKLENLTIQYLLNGRQHK